MSEAQVNGQTVFVIDDDEGVRDALDMLLRAAGLHVRTFDAARAFLRQFSADLTGCLVLDIRMPGMSGLELQDELRKRRSQLPIVFLTGHGDIPMAVRALKKGAVDFIEKPHDEHRLVLAVYGALHLGAERHERSPSRPHAPTDLSQRLAELTAREREVLDRVLKGATTRAIAEGLCVSVKTIEFHRARIREKLCVGSLAELFGLFLAHGDEYLSGVNGIETSRLVEGE